MPPKKPGVRVCVVFGNEGVKLYGNRAAFASLAEWMNWLAQSPQNEHFECHVGMDLEDDASKFGGKKPRNAWTLTTPDIGRAKEPGAGEMDLNLMCLEEAELDQLAEYQETGVLTATS